MASRLPNTDVAISVVVCAYTADRWDDLVEAVESVRAQEVPALELILVVDHNPALLERARMRLGGVHVLPNAEARGLSGARNTGVRAARGDVVAFLDDDAAAAPDWLARITARYQDPYVLGVGGAIEPRWVDRPPPALPAEFRWVIGCSYEGLPTTAAPVRNLIGANMSVRRDVFEQVGGFRTGIGRVGSLPVGCEETELCIRARQHRPGGEFVYEPAARVSHVVPPSRTTWRYFCSRCWAEGRSKAQVSAERGARDALASERLYVRRILPLGVWRGLSDARRGDPHGAARAAAIVVGLALTALGYLTGMVRGRAVIDS